MPGFIPFSIDGAAGRRVVRWIERAATPVTLPFFAQWTRERLASGACQRESALDALVDAEGPEPAGLVMHLSRCGSTLLMQALAHAGCIAPISEPTPVNQLLACSDIPEQERAVLLRGLVRALGSQDEAASPLPSVLKMTSWNVLFVDVVRAAFPDTPWLFLYREPLEILVSHQRRPARWLSDERFFAALTAVQRLPPLHGLFRGQRGASVLAAYGQAALDASPAALNLLNYNQLPAALVTDVPARFGVSASPTQQGQIADASRIYSKDASRRLVFDSDAERRACRPSDAVHQADRHYSRPIYDALERRRIGGPLPD